MDQQTIRKTDKQINPRTEEYMDRQTNMQTKKKDKQTNIKKTDK